MRALHLGELERAGEARATALAEADAQLDRIARLLPDALQAGVSLSEIARAAGVSRPTLYELRARYGDSSGDLYLGVLQTVATNPGIAGGELRDRLKQSGDALKEPLASFVAQGCIVEEVDEDGESPALVYYLTAKGDAVLEEWRFRDSDGDA